MPRLIFVFLFHFFIFHFSLQYNAQGNLGTINVRILKYDTYVEHELLYCVKENRHPFA